MATSSLQPSRLWSAWQALKGMDPRTVNVSDIDLGGKWVLITGSNNGIGREAALRFAQSGCNIILACRQPPSYETHPEKVVEECKTVFEKYGKQCIVEWWEVDMAKLSSVEGLARRWNDTGRNLDLLVNNAGMTALDQLVLTEDGFEICHQVNFLSHALLTLSILPSMARASNARIVCTSSALHYSGVFDISNANSGINPYANNKLYFQTWLSEVQLRLLQQPEYKHIVAHGVHPGIIKSAIFGSNEDDSGSKKKADLFFLIMSRIQAWIGVSQTQGGLALYHATTAPELALQEDRADEYCGGAKYINRIWVEEPSPFTKDSACRAAVWNLVERELGSGKRAALFRGLDALTDKNEVQHHAVL